MRKVAVFLVIVAFASCTAAGTTKQSGVPTLTLRAQNLQLFPGSGQAVRIGGPVTLQAVVSAALDGMRLACMLCCVGAANTLANPKRALRVLPGALYELGVAVTVGVAFISAPACLALHAVLAVYYALAQRGGSIQPPAAMGDQAMP